MCWCPRHIGRLFCLLENPVSSRVSADVRVFGECARIFYAALQLAEVPCCRSRQEEVQLSRLFNKEDQQIKGL